MESFRILTAAETSAVAVEVEENLRVPYYCEENIWRLAFRRQFHRSREQQQPTPNETDWVLFISNPSKCCPMFYQKASPDPSRQPCCWDYHVVLLSIPKTTHESTMVFDLDTTLPFPCDLSTYTTLSFQEHHPQPLFRIVSANTFLTHFYCDRRHMFCADTNLWYAKPPAYSSVMNGHAQFSRGQIHSYTDAQPLLGSNLHLYNTMRSADIIPVHDVILPQSSSSLHNQPSLLTTITSTLGILVDMDGLFAIVSLLNINE